MIMIYKSCNIAKIILGLFDVVFEILRCSFCTTYIAEKIDLRVDPMLQSNFLNEAAKKDGGQEFINFRILFRFCQNFDFSLVFKLVYLTTAHDTKTG